MAMLFFEGEPDFQHGEVPAVGVLFAILGTPEAPTASAVRPYLRQFLGDPRVIEVSRPLWWLILNCFVLPFRPKRSAEAYSTVWTEEGSPLMVISEKQVAGVRERLAAELGSPVHVALGATYGNPSMRSALDGLRAKGCRRILFFPLFSHYSSTSTGAALDAMMRVLMTWRWVPEIRTIHQYHDEPGYITALADSIRERWQMDGEPDLLLMSFHGLPQRYLDAGDLYHCQCLKTARLLAEALRLGPKRWVPTFQSRFGREPWIKPYTDMTIKALPAAGIKKLDVVCPGFAADCLETLEEIEEENRGYFMEAGGEQFRYLPALNDRPDHVALLAELVQRNLGGWVQSKDTWDHEEAARAGQASCRRAETLLANPAKDVATIGS